jgi:hypothetical protein
MYNNAESTTHGPSVVQGVIEHPTLLADGVVERAQVGSRQEPSMCDYMAGSGPHEKEKEKNIFKSNVPDESAGAALVLLRLPLATDFP